jgi:NAD(P)-dependent dehydrogenase (short-subunit alcohol dehydrogenase family)
LLLVSRRGPAAPGIAELTRELAASGAQVSVAACDVADRAALADLLAGIPAEHPLTSVVHAAGVPAGGTIDTLTADRLADVLRPTVLGARHLHELTEHHDLAGFVLCSALAGTVASPGQGSSAAASAFLDALAEQRAERGLPAIAVGWGPWLDEGMRHDSPAGRRFLRRTGTAAMAPHHATLAFAELLGRDRGALLVADIDWARLLPLATGIRPTRLFDDIPEVVRIQQADVDSAGASALDELTRLSRVDLGRRLLKLVRTEAAQVLGHRDGSIADPHRPFRDLGFDSTGSIEFRNRLIQATGLALPASLVFDYPTAITVVDFMMTELELFGAPAAEPQNAVVSLDSATDQEMFEFIGNEFGIS